MHFELNHTSQHIAFMAADRVSAGVIFPIQSYKQFCVWHKHMPLLFPSVTFVTDRPPRNQMWQPLPSERPPREPSSHSFRQPAPISSSLSRGLSQRARRAMAAHYEFIVSDTKEMATSCTAGAPWLGGAENPQGNHSLISHYCTLRLSELPPGEAEFEYLDNCILNGAECDAALLRRGRVRQFKVSQPLLESGRGNLNGAVYPLKQSMCSVHLCTFLFYMLRDWDFFNAILAK